MIQTVTIAQALQSNLSGLVVKDSAANIAAALPNPGLVARVHLFELSGTATVATAAADRFAALGAKFVAGYALTVQDSVAAMTASANAAGLALASSRGIIDAAYNLLGAAPSAFTNIASVTLTGTPTLSATQLTKLEGLPGFTFAIGAHFTFADSLAAAAPLLVAHPSWFAASTAVAIHLDGSQVSAGVAVALAALANASKTVSFTPSGANTTLNITAAAHDLASDAASINRVGQLVGVHVAVTNDGSAISVADAVALTTISGFAPSQHTLYVSDTGAAITAAGAALFNHGYPRIIVASGNFSGIAAELLDPTLHLLPGATVSMIGTPTLTVAQILVLDALPGFAVAPGATLTVSDTVSHILAHAGSLAAATTININDSEIITAANLGTLGTIAAAHPGHFNLGGHTLSVADSAASIAQNEAAINSWAATALVNTPASVSAAQADLLVPLANANKLFFQAGDTLTVADSYAALSSGGNATGVSLASNIQISDTAANLVLAAGHNWNGVVPSYLLSANAIISGAQAVTLAGLGGHFISNAYVLTVQDNAANVLNDAAALTSLGISANVTDTAANIDAAAGGLAGLGVHLAGVQVTDIGAITPAAAAGLLPLSAKLLAGPVLVAGNVASIDAYHAALQGLGAHVAIALTDSAAAVGGEEIDLAALGTALTITLTDIAPVTALTAAEVGPLGARFAVGTSLAVSDTAANIVAEAPALQSMGNAIGVLSLQGGNGVNVAQAVALLGLQSHFGVGVQLAVAGLAADISANVVSLLALQSDGRVASVTDSGESIAAVAVATAGLNAVGATVNISDTMADFNAGLGSLAYINGLAGITITDVPHPIFSLSLAQYGSEGALINHITNNHTVNIADTASAIEADLSSPHPILATINGLENVSVIGGAPLVLSQAAALNPAVQTVLAEYYSGQFQVTGVDVAHLTAVTALAPASITMSDSTADITADLSSNNSLILAHLSAISAITATGGGNITLTATQALSPNVDEGVTALFTKLTGAGLNVTGASVAQVSALESGVVAPHAISVNDTAANITAALTNPNSPIMTWLSSIVTLNVSDGNPIVLTENQDLAPNVNSGPTPALRDVTGASIIVTNVTTSALGQVEAGARTPDQIQIADSGADISASIAPMLLDRLNLGPITVTSGSVILTVAQAETAHVADGVGSLVSLLIGHNYGVSGALISDIPTLIGLAQAPGTIAVSDSSANVAADITGPNSQIFAHANSVTVTGGTLTLTDAQMNIVINNNNVGALDHLAPGQIIDVTGVPVADVGLFSQLAGGLLLGVALHLEVSDTALAIATDLGSPNSLLTHDLAYVHSVTLSGAGGTLTPTQLEAVADLSGVNTNSIIVPVLGDAADIVGLDAAGRALAGTMVTVTDTSANVEEQLPILQLRYAGHLTINLTDQTAIDVNALAFTTFQPTIDAITNTGVINVIDSASAIAGIEPALLADVHVRTVTVNDSAASIVTNLSAIEPLGNNLYVNVLPEGDVSAAIAQALVNANLAHLFTGPLTVADTGAQIAAMVESSPAAAQFFFTNQALLNADSNVSLVDAEALNSIPLDKNSYAINVWDTAAHLTAPGAAVELNQLSNSDFIGGIFLKTTGGVVNLTAANAVALLAIPDLIINNPDNSPNSITVSDTTAHLQTSYTGLSDDLESISAIAINASATVNETTLADMQNLGATTTSGVTLTLADTAGNILAASEVNSPSVQASAYILSASAAVDSADALALADLPNFSTAGNTLTVQLNANTPLNSVSQANQLGALGTGLVVTGHEYTISGGVSSLTGLTTAGASVAHVMLSDSLADVSALSATSPLLTGTIAITDAEFLTASQAQAFLTLLSTAGVADGNVSFTGGAEIVGDTVANLRTLTSSTAWMGNALLQSHLSLVANDTAANLDNPANRAFLNTLSSQVLVATATVSAANATALTSLSHFSVGLGQSLIVSDSAANLLSAANSTGLGAATSITLNGAASLNATQAEQLLQISHFALTQSLTITDSSANLLDGTLSGLIAGASLVHVGLASSENLDTQTASALVSLQGFSDTLDMHVVDTSSYLLAASASAAEAMAASVSLAGNETVSANTVLRLSEIPHFITSGGTLTLAGNDFADAPTLKAIADMGTHFSEGGHSLTLTQDDLALTPTEYAAVVADGVIGAGHVISAQLVNDSVSVTNNIMSVTATGVAGASVSVYDNAGHLLSNTVENNASFVVSAADTGSGNNFSITETVAGVESAPVVVLNATTLEGLVTGADATFSTSGQIQVGTGEYLNLYTAGATLPNAPSLVYDPNAHTISLDIPNTAPVVLITLGASTHPASIDPTEILVKHHS